MKVAFLLQDSRALYGAERATVALVAGLAAAHVEVRILLLRETRLGGNGEGPFAEALARTAPVLPLPIAGRFSWKVVRQIRSFVHAESIDVLHASGYKADWHAGLAAQWGKRFPVVGTVHGWLFRRDLKERLFQCLDLVALRRFSRVVVLCRFYHRYLEQHGVPPSRLAMIPTGLAADAVVRRDQAAAIWQDPGALFTFGLLGRLSEEKNPALLLDAAERLARSNPARPWRILVAGEGNLRRKLEQEVCKHGLSNRVHMPGRMEPDEFFRQTHVLVQCSRVENQPLSVMEAMAWMRPVLATNVGGLPELVEDAQTGHLLNSGQAGDLERAMSAYLTTPATAEAQGRRGRDRIEREYRTETMIRDHIELYQSLKTSMDALSCKPS